MYLGFNLGVKFWGGSGLRTGSWPVGMEYEFQAPGNPFTSFHDTFSLLNRL